MLVGKATDPSGFGGASFSSVTLDAADEDANKGAVQVPDPFLKNVLMRASYRVFAMLRALKLTVGFKDLGAGGIMGCSAEITSSGGYGADIDLDLVNVAVEGMPPEVIAVGETQERLIWVLPPEITPEVLRIYNEEFTLPQIAHNARASVIGRMTGEQRYVLRHRGKRRDGRRRSTSSPARSKTNCRTSRPSGTIRRSTNCPRSTWPRSFRKCSRIATSARAFRSTSTTIAVVRGATVLARGTADAGVLEPIPGSPSRPGGRGGRQSAIRAHRCAQGRRAGRARSGASASPPSARGRSA